MAMVTAQLAAAITANQLTFNITNIVGNFSPTVGTLPLSYGNPMLIDTEIMYVVSQPATGTITVRTRGADGTAATAHDTLANVYTSAVAGDFGAIPSGITVTIDPTDDVVYSLGQDQTVPIPSSNSVYNINKVTAAALTLPAPQLVDNGLALIFTSQTAAAHVITATSLLQDGSTSVPRSTLTFAAAKGATVTLIAENGFWNVSALQNVTAS